MSSFLERLQTERTIDAIENIVYCPQCNTPTINGDSNSSNVFCAQCYHWFCSECREEGHRGNCYESNAIITPEASQSWFNRLPMHLPGKILTDGREREVREREAREREEKRQRKKEE